MKPPTRTPDRIILINGLPGSGKTTLAHRLGDTLGVPVISKDAVKEALIAAVPAAPPRRLGAIAMEACWAIAAETRGRLCWSPGGFARATAGSQKPVGACAASPL